MYLISLKIVFKKESDSHRLIDFSGHFNKEDSLYAVLSIIT